MSSGSTGGQWLAVERVGRVTTRGETGRELRMAGRSETIACRNPGSPDDRGAFLLRSAAAGGRAGGADPHPRGGSIAAGRKRRSGTPTVGTPRSVAASRRHRSHLGSRRAAHRSVAGAGRSTTERCGGARLARHLPRCCRSALQGFPGSTPGTAGNFLQRFRRSRSERFGSLGAGRIAR